MSPDGFGKPPPEEKLLKLIRGRPARPPSEAASFPRSGPILTASAQAAKALVARPGARAPGWPMIAIWALAAFLVLEVALLIVQALRPLPPIPRPVEAAAEVQPAPPSAPEMPSLSASISRPIFSSSAAGPAATTAAPVSNTAKLLSARLTLMGIVAGEPPQAIIEDAETKKTFFVTVGQMVVEGAVVEQVLDNRVVLNAAGEKIELSL